MDDTIESLTAACLVFNETDYSIPARDGFNYTKPETGLLEWMPAMKTGDEVMLKLVGYHPNNPDRRGLPTILSTAMTFDTQSGHLSALMDSTFLTALRTGASSAVASRILASPESQNLGIIGAGAQSITQLHALSRIFDLKNVAVYDIDESVSNSFQERAKPLNLQGMQITACSLEQVIKSSDIICTATSVEIGAGPVFFDSGLSPGVHINAVGSDFPGKTELPYALLQRSLVCPDFLAQAIKEGECQQLEKEQIGPDLVALVKAESGYRAYQNSTTVFDSTGWAFEDYIVVHLLARYGQQLGCGREIELSCISTDPRNPYAFLQR